MLLSKGSTLLGIALGSFVYVCTAEADVRLTSARGTPSTDDTRLVPVHAKICAGNVVDKTKLFFQLLGNVSPPVSDTLKFGLAGNWHRLVIGKNICPGFNGCGPKDAQAIANLRLNFVVFLSSGASEGYYRPSDPKVSISQYFRNNDNHLQGVYCTSNLEPPPASPAVSPLDVNSPVRVRGISDDLWIDQKSPLFPKSSSASINYTQNDSTAGAFTKTTSIQTAVGYDFALPNISAAVWQDVIPFIAANESITDTQNKNPVFNQNNFVAGGVLYQATVQQSWGFNQITLKPQFVRGTTMDSDLTSLQIIYAPWTDDAVLAPFPPLNSVINVVPAAGIFPSVNGQLLFDVRTDLGYYEDRGLPAFVEQNANFARAGSKFGFALIATPSILPTFALNVTETALYGAGSFKSLSYFDALLSVYFDTKHYFSATAEYFNGRDENTYVFSREVKAGIAAHF